MRAVRYVIGSFVAIAIAACAGTPDDTARVKGAPGPVAPSNFKPVAAALVVMCGTIDCHGSQYRNMRLYGYGGERLSPTALPDALGPTDEEVQADWEAIVGVEPELYAQVIAEGGVNPERLTLYRKGRGLEAHRAGNRLVTNGDASGDTCLRSWLASNPDVNACAAVLPDGFPTK